MSTPKYEYRSLKITELLLNPTNPRFDPVKHQLQTITAMIEDQQGKLASLAEHILDNGLNPTDIILVQPYDQQWLVLEGNRRVTALKLANEPELVGEQYPKFKKEFQKLNAILDNVLLENIPCVIIEDKDLANEWIRLKHTGENDGAGTVRWDGQQTSRFSLQTNGNSDSRILFLDELKTSDNIPQEYKDRFSFIKKTNFDRLMSDPDVRSLLGIANQGGSLSLINEVNPYLLVVLYDLAFEDLSVGSIYLKDDRRKYIEEIRKKVEISQSSTDDSPSTGSSSTTFPISSDGDSVTGPNYTDNSNTFGTHNTLHGETENTGKNSTTGTQSGGRRKSYPVNRKTLVPSQHKLNISHARLVRVFNELKAMDIDAYPNAIAALFRVFIELGADCYISKNNIPSVNADSKLSQKIEAVAADLETKGIMTKNELRAARQMSSSQTQNISIKTFHSYVHNKDVTPSSTDLKSAWDDLWTFIENIWR